MESKGRAYDLVHVTFDPGTGDAPDDATTSGPTPRRGAWAASATPSRTPASSPRAVTRLNALSIDSTERPQTQRVSHEWLGLLVALAVEVPRDQHARPLRALRSAP